MTELDEFQMFVKEQLELIDRANMLKRVSEMSEQSRDDLYHILCDRACVNTDSADAQKAWEAIVEGGQEVK